MAIRDLLEAFEGEDLLPVDLKKVADWTRARGLQDEIEFIGVDLDVGVIRGFLHRFRYCKVLYGDAVNCAHIYYDRNQGPEWINMVCAKELTHLADGSPPVKRKDDLDHLLERLALPSELKVLLEDPAFAAFDKFGDAFAAAILLPISARELLLGHYEDETITDADIARLAVIPERYVRTVMSPHWPALYARMKQM